MALKEIADVVAEYSGNSRAVLEYSLVMKRLIDSAKDPGFSAESWAPLAELVAVGEFGRVGPFKEVQDWPGYVEFLTAWATSSEWEGKFKRITERGDLVILELEEHNKVGDWSSVVNSVSVYEMTGDGKIRQLDVYLQMEMPSSDMLKAVEDLPISSE